MRFLVVDDDYLEVQKVEQALKARFRATVEIIETEEAFVAQLDRIAAAPPDLIVLDVMLRWTDPRPDLRLDDIPDDVREEGFYTAGLRCLSRLQARETTKNIPVILYTTLDQNDFQQHVVHTKEEDLEPLLNEIWMKLKELQSTRVSH